MNLYKVECGVYVYYSIAKTPDDAVIKVQEKENLKHLPFAVTEIDLEGYKLVKR